MAKRVKKPIKKSNSPNKKQVIVQQSATPFAETLKKKYVSVGLGLAFIILLLILLKNVLIVALVNGQPIWRFTVIKELEKQGGKQVLNSLVTNTLIYQEAKKRNIQVDNNEIQEEMKKISGKISGGGQNLDQLLAAQGMTKKDFEERIRLEKTVEKLLNKKITINDSELADYIEKNKSSFSETGPDDQTKETIRQQLLQEKLNKEYNTFIQELQKNAKISYYINY